MKQLFGRTRPAKPGAPRSPAPSESPRGVDLSTKIEPFPYTNAPPVITPTQQRNLANMGSLAPATDLRNDPLMTAPERRQSLRARESSDEPWVVINESIQNPDSRSASIASLMPGAAAPYNSPQFMQASTVVPSAVQSLPSSPVMQQQQPPQLSQQQQQQPQQPRSQQASMKRPPNPSANSNPPSLQQPPPQQQPTFSAVNGHSPQPYSDLSHRGPNPVDRAFVESQENVREGSIHSQQEKSWTRNFFGGSGGVKEKEANAELMRMIGFLTAAAPDDWNLVLEVCERASANENAAKEASRALRREFRYGEPSAQLSAARLWAIMLQNATDTFILQTASRKFLDNLEEVISAETTSPVVRERLLDVLGSAAYEYGRKPGKEGFMSLWKRVRPPWKPIEGVPFDPEDMMFDSAFPRRAVPPGQTPVPQSQQPQQQQPGQQVQQPHPDSDRDRRRKEREREKYYQRQQELAQQQQHYTPRSTPTPHVPSRRERGIIPPEEDIRKLFEECDVARNNAQILSQALTFASPSTLGTDAVIQEFHSKCRASQELIVAQIPWASAGAERSIATKKAKESSSDGNANGKLLTKRQQQQNGAQKNASSDLTKEERLLAALLLANEELIEVFRIYEELEKMAFAEMEEKEAAKRSIVETRIDRTKIDFISPDGSFTSSRQGASSSRSPSPLPPPARSPPNVTITTSATNLSGKRDLPLPPPSANEHMNPTVNVPANIPPSHYQQQPSPLQPQALQQQQIPPTQSPPPNHPPPLHHAHHASNHSIGGYANLNLPPSAPHGPRHSPSTRSRTPSPDRPGVPATGNTPTAVTPAAHEYGPPPHPPPHLAARTAGARVDSLRRTESPAPGLAPPGLTVGGGGSAGVHNVSGVRIDMEAAKGYMNSDDEDLMTPVRPSEKALGKRRAPVEEAPNEEELERREEAEMEEAFMRSTAPPGSELESPKQTIHYVYDAAAERARELDRMEREEMERERRQREQARNSMQRVPGAGSGGGSTAAAAAPTVVGAVNARP